MQVAREPPYRPPVMRLRLNSDRLEKHRDGDMARMGNEGNGHPRLNRFVRRVDAPYLSTSPEGEKESARDRKQEGESQN